jgi:hypothetical protein
LVDLKPPAQWDAGEWRDVLYAIAGDLEDEVLVDELVDRHPDVLLATAARGVHDGDVDARLSLAAALGRANSDAGPREPLLPDDTDEVAEPPGRVDIDRDACEALLLDYHDDEEEVVRRYALNALGEMRSRHTERIALEEWDRVLAEETSELRGVRQSRINSVLHALHRVRAPSFERVLTAAEADKSVNVSEYAAHMRIWVADGGEGHMPWFRPSDAALRETDEQHRLEGLPPLPRDVYREPPSRLASLLSRLSGRRKNQPSETGSE